MKVCKLQNFFLGRILFVDYTIYQYDYCGDYRDAHALIGRRIASISPLSPRARLRPGRTRAKSNICQFFREPKIGKSFPISNFLRLSHQTSILWQNFIDWYIRQSQTYLPLLKDEENFPARITGQEGIVSNDYFKNFPVFVEVCLSFSTK